MPITTGRQSLESTPGVVGDMFEHSIEWIWSLIAKDRFGSQHTWALTFHVRHPMCGTGKRSRYGVLRGV